MTWTDEAVNALKQYWKDGLSASYIARNLSSQFKAEVSRNAVLGKVHRLRLESRAHLKGRRDGPAGRVGVKPTIPKPTPKRALPGLTAADVPPHPDGLVKLADLQPNQCRFPYGDPQDPDFGFCGRTCEPGQVYCKAHYRVAYLPVAKRRKSFAVQ